MTAVTAIKKEKTAKIIPNAVAVSTQEEVHTFTSFISRDATYKVITKAWRKALAKSNIIDSVSLFFLALKIIKDYFKEPDRGWNRWSGGKL